MASDRSRFSYDEAQQYRSVVVQQGKALLDSDLNEAQQILAEETRRDALDIVGHTGTPNEGYKITIPAGTTNADFSISAGTMYVGGVRVSLPGDPAATPPAFRYTTQPEWRSPLGIPTTFPVQEYIWLELVEHEVSALEDSALLEPALGGPDTAQRTHILQRIRRTPVTVSTCADALTAQIATWRAEGATYVEGTRRLLPQTSLKVGVAGPPPSTNPCDPVVQGGFLGAENQLIRVMITGANTFVWSLDDASSQYRVDHVNGARQLILTSAPVDEMHQPRATQILEITRGRIPLPNGEFAGEPLGRIMSLAADYNADARMLTLSNDLPPEYMPAPNLPIYLRVWEAEVSFVPVTPVALGATGLTVTLQVAAGGVFARGDFWTFAVRPSTPATVYPKRYLTAFQPPEGPRRWATGLAVLNWKAATDGSIADDCREKFDDLVTLTKRRSDQKSCCTVILAPSDVPGGSLQSFVTRATAERAVKICLLPGDYVLHEPVTITGPNVTIEGCRGGVSLSGDGSDAFANGIVQITGANATTLRGIVFRLPFLQLKSRAGTSADQLGISLGVRAIDASNLKVEDCSFIFDSPNTRFSASFGAAVLVGGETFALTVRRNIFGGALGASTIGVAMAPGFVVTQDVPSLLFNRDLGNFDNTVLALESARVLTRSAATAAAAAGPGAAAGEAAGPRTSILAGTVPVEAISTTPGATTVTPPIKAIGTVPGTIIEPGIGTVSPGITPIVVSPPKQQVATGSMFPATLSAADIVENRFVQCAAAAYLCGDVGTLRIERNQVEMGIDGFVVVAPRWIPLLSFLNGARVAVLFRLLGNAFNNAASLSPSLNAAQAAGETLAALAHPLRSGLASALFSIAPPTVANDRLVPMGEVANDGDSIGALTARAIDAFRDESSKDPEAIASFIGTLSTRAAVQWRTVDPIFFFSNPAIGRLGFAPLAGRSRQFTPAIECRGNSVAGPTAAGVTLFVLDTEKEMNSSVIVGDNRFTNESLPLPTAVVALISRCTVTGNLIQNETAGTGSVYSLVLIAGIRPVSTTVRFPPPLVAITGNVFRGSALLPPRPLFAAPLNNWQVLNTESF